MSNHTALFLKLFTLFLFTLLMLIPISMILNLIDSRNDYRQSVINRIQDGASAEQTVVGPIIAIPYTLYQKEQDEKGVSKTVAIERVSYHLPTVLTVDGDVNVEPRKVGIYQAQVYQSELTFKGSFTPSNMVSNSSVSYGAPYIIVALSDSRGITRVPEIQFAKKTIAFEAGTNSSRFAQGMHVPLTGDMLGGSAPIGFEFTLALQGSGHLSVMPVGESSTLNLSGNWPHPNFLGQFLPKQRVVNDDGFTATWESSWIANNINNNFTGYDYQNMSSKSYGEETYGDYRYGRATLPVFSTSFIEPVNHYQLNTRTVKYAVLFIGLTFVAFFLFEVLKSLSIHPVQYLLVAAALTVFYVILLALSERIGFAWAYCIAAVSCCSLIGFYLSAVLRGAVRGIGFAVGLLLLYGVLYLLLQSEDNALLLGALLLFVALSAVMALTRRLDWYQVAGRPSPPSSNKGPVPAAMASSGGGAPAPQEANATDSDREKGTHCHSEEQSERKMYRLWK